MTLDRFTPEFTEEGLKQWVRYQTMEMSGVRVYDSQEQIFNFFSKAIGTAACGDFSRHQWNDGESRFQLLEYRVKEDCYPSNLIPEEYPVIYRFPE